jgi:hypothetical protein
MSGQCFWSVEIKSLGWDLYKSWDLVETLYRHVKTRFLKCPDRESRSRSLQKLRPCRDFVSMCWDNTLKCWDHESRSRPHQDKSWDCWDLVQTLYQHVETSLWSIEIKSLDWHLEKIEALLRLCWDFVETLLRLCWDFVENLSRLCIDVSRQGFWSVEIKRLDRKHVKTKQDPQA